MFALCWRELIEFIHIHLRHISNFNQSICKGCLKSGRMAATCSKLLVLRVICGYLHTSAYFFAIEVLKGTLN